MKSRRNLPKNQPQSQPQQMEEKKVKKMSQYRDYMSMKAYNTNFRKNKNKKKAIKQLQKHSLSVHAHLQPDQPEDESDDDRAENNPITIMANYSTQQYDRWIQVMKERVSCQKPYTDQHPMLLDALAMKSVNICVYGFGSKIEYLRYLMKSYMSDHYIWEINGFTQGMNEKKIVNNFGKFLKQIGIGSDFKQYYIQKQIVQYSKCLKNYAKSNQKQIIVLFHCLDSINFINSDCQMILSQLFKMPKIKLVCSVDSIKIATCWHPKIKTNFHFKFFHINTRVPYIHEQLFRPNATDVRQRQDQAIKHIYQSLSHTQRRILKLIAKQQLDNFDRQQPQYFTKDTLLQQCIDNAILCNDVQLRQNLSQLLDHKVLIQRQKNQIDKVRKYYIIQCNKAMLERLLCEKIES